MKAKQIEKLLTGVMNNFLESIPDNYIKDIIKEDTYITGGSIPSMLMDEFVNDYDFYFYNSNYINVVKDYFETTHTKNKNDKFHVKLITENAINLSDKIQIIIKFVGDPKVVTNKFDWQHIKSWYSCKEEKLHLTSDVYQLVVEKELIYTGSDYPLSSLMRLKKYIKKGWNVSNTTILHIALDIVASFNKMEAERQFEQAKYGREQLEKINKKLQNITSEEFDELLENATITIKKNEIEFDTDNMDEPCQELDNFEIITDPVELDYINKMSKVNNQQTFNVDDIIYHLNGVDPIIIQEKFHSILFGFLCIIFLSFILLS